MYECYAIPAPGGLARQAALPGRARACFPGQARAPLLLIAGGSDRLVAARLTRATYRRYARAPAWVPPP